ncbi:peptidylprolyl isomerase [Terribacillus halophilus]|uniref:peptidylprolyl isomerase n=1 Tax=Terribacillus halophilus TaxID=361279 RepID=UPI00098540D6|nr:peptidylprolyl isomerase [Terribacillus halophilus]
MKKLAIAAVFATSVVALSACGSGETVVESKAGDISKEDYYQELSGKYGEQVLQTMVLEKALDDKYDVEKEQIDKQVDKLKDQYGDSFDSVLQQAGYSDEDAFREKVKASLLQQKAIADGVEVTDEEIQTRYDHMKTDLNASHILVADEDTAKEVKKKLDDGEEWDKLVEEYSTDTGTVEAKGSLDWFSAGSMDAAFENAAYALDKGEISEPVESSFGWHIIRLDDKRDTENEVGSLKEEKEQIKTELAVQKVDSAEQQEKINKLLKDADFDIKIEQYEDLIDNMTAASATAG